MAHHDQHEQDHDVISVAHFFEEYWPLLFFGCFFLMTCYMPLLFIDKKDIGWLYGAFTVTIMVALGLLTIPAWVGPKK